MNVGVVVCLRQRREAQQELSKCEGEGEGKKMELFPDTNYCVHHGYSDCSLVPDGIFEKVH